MQKYTINNIKYTKTMEYTLKKYYFFFLNILTLFEFITRMFSKLNDVQLYLNMFLIKLHSSSHDVNRLITKYTIKHAFFAFL